MPLDVLQRHRLHQVDLAREQRGDARRVVADRREDDLVEIAVGLAPPVEVLDQHRANRRLALLQAERAGAVGLEAGGVLDPLATIDRTLGLVLLAPLPAHDLARVVRVSGRIGYGALVSISTASVADLAHFLDRARVALHVGAFAGGALECEDDVVGRERRAVVEFDSLAQVEAPHGRARLRPLRRQRRREAHVLAALDQRLVDVAGEAELQALVERVRVHRLHVALVGDPKGHGLRQRRQESERRGDEPGSDSFHGSFRVRNSG